MSRLLALVSVVVLSVLGLAAAGVLRAEDDGESRDKKKSKENPVVLMKTSMGDIEIELWPDAAPKTVKTFLALAEGEKEWKHPETDQMKSAPFYDGLTFHRVIPKFMIQGGDPLGQGMGGPGFQFEDEINAKGLGLDKEQVIDDKGRAHPYLLIRSEDDFQRTIVAPLLREMKIDSQEDLDKRRDEVDKRIKSMTLEEAYENLGYAYDDSLEAKEPKRGVIAMANSGPNTNGSQFFINVADTPHLAGKHTVFGAVTKGMDVVDQISNVATEAGNRPAEPVRILSVRRK